MCATQLYVQPKNRFPKRPLRAPAATAYLGDRLTVLSDSRGGRPAGAQGPLPGPAPSARSRRAAAPAPLPRARQGRSALRLQLSFPCLSRLLPLFSQWQRALLLGSQWQHDVGLSLALPAALGSNHGRRGATGEGCRPAPYRPGPLRRRGTARGLAPAGGGWRAAGGAGGAWDWRASSQTGSVRAGGRGLLPSRGEAFARVNRSRLSRRRCSTITARKATSTTSGLRRTRRWGGWAATRCSSSTGPTAP